MFQPLTLQIETTALCSARCSFCVYPEVGAARGLRHMDQALFEKIVDDAADLEVFAQYVLNGLGEPLLDPELERRIAYVCAADPGVAIKIYTHGAHLTPARWERLRDAGLTDLSISLNAVRADQHERVTGLRGAFDRICANAEYALANARGASVRVHAVFNEAFPEADAHEFVRRWGHWEHGGVGLVAREGNWAGARPTDRPLDPASCCWRALGGLYILADGRVSPCCFDPLATLCFGDLKTQSLDEVYSSAAYVAFRKAHVENRADAYPICAGCTRI